jgi:hypothetical protein
MVFSFGKWGGTKKGREGMIDVQGFYSIVMSILSLDGNEKIVQTSH